MTDELHRLWNALGGRGEIPGRAGRFYGPLLVLGGVPMTGDGHYFDPPWYRTEFTDRASEMEWKHAIRNIFNGRVSSLSGRTAEWIGNHRLECVN